MNTDSRVALALPTGMKLDHYEISGTIGQGAFGLTYKSFSHRYQTACVLKELLPVDFATRAPQSHEVVPLMEENRSLLAKCRVDFKREAAILHEVNHPNVVKILDFFDSNGTSYMVMPFADGCDYERFLKNLKASGRVLTEEELLQFLFPVMDGLACVHSRGFLHRDIKPENILVTKSGSPLLIDFGAARQVIGSRSRPISMILTPKYAPFEQYSSTQRQGPYTDIYSLGAVMHRVLTGEPPLEAPDRAAGEDRYVPLASRCRERYSHKFLAAIDWALRPKKEARPQTIAEWQAEFPRPKHFPAVRPVETRIPPPLPCENLPPPPPLPEGDSALVGKLNPGRYSQPPPPPDGDSALVAPRPSAAPAVPAPDKSPPRPLFPTVNKMLIIVAAAAFLLCFLLIFIILRLVN